MAPPLQQPALAAAFAACAVLAAAYLVHLVRLERRQRAARAAEACEDGVVDAGTDHACTSDVSGPRSTNQRAAEEEEEEEGAARQPLLRREDVAGDEDDDEEEEEGEILGAEWNCRRGRRLESVRRRLRRVLRRSALPWPVLVVSFLNAFVLSFPMNFFGQFISAEIGMTPTQFTQYYALTFLPFSFKPLYAYMAERIRVCGSGRRGYLVFCNVMISACMLVMATIAEEVWHVFVIGFLQNFFEAAAGMVVGLILIDAACIDQQEIPNLQAEQTLWRYMGTFTALLLSLPVSGCFSYAWDNRTALIVSAMIPLLSATAAQWLPKRSRTDVQNVGALGDPESGSDTDEQYAVHLVQHDLVRDEDVEASEEVVGASSQDGVKASVERQALMLFVPTLVLFELVAIAVGVHGNFAAAGKLGAWHGLVGFFAVSLVAWIVAAGVGVYRWGDVTNVRALLVISVPCIYLFVVDAVPSSMDAMSSYKYHVFRSQCDLQALSLFSTAARIGGLFAYRRFFASSSVEVSVLANTILCSIVSLLDIIKVNDPRGIMAEGETSTFWTWLVIDVCSSFVSAFYLVSKEVVATHYSFSLLNRVRKQHSAAALGERLDRSVRADAEDANGAKQATLARALSPGILYSVYLTCFDVGASASGFLTAAVMSSLNITYTDFAGLPDLIWICALSFLATAALIPTLQCAQHPSGSQSAS
ncbi:Hypothetical Protein FCC1311_051582 [Hondaea fermentalgiana]|uniref:Uncharacterized protein n=1 Tax=Hondaea fermentalgiana TaxID=2315210 RepID=A0A2R5GDC1_9STRA|nr:Hypothetical Protein FCC1311_051582 [Hondaea fermentalgiana]|eukprot:GBG28937.1 Hypothetical Protein FCC1311_051582 [Hondaea fermentalgiana]